MAEVLQKPINQKKPARQSKLKQKWLALTLRAQIFVSLGIVAFLGLIVFAAIDPLIVSGKPGVILRFEPVDATASPGELLVVDLVLDTGNARDGFNDVVAVAAVFDIDPTQLSITCTGTSSCPGVQVNKASWNTVAELQEQNGRVTVVVGSNTPVSGTGIKVATISFLVLDGIADGSTEVNFVEADSAVIADDGFGTDILGELHSQDWTIRGGINTGGVRITSGPSAIVDCQSPQASITWFTNVAASSGLAYSLTSCPGCTWEEFVNQADTVTVTNNTPATDHSFTIPESGNLNANATYYYRATNAVGADIAVSGENSLFTGCVGDIEREFKITNLSVETFARSAIVTWNTNSLADTNITGSNPNDLGQSIWGSPTPSWTDPTQTLSHSLRISALVPETNYCIRARSVGVLDTGIKGSCINSAASPPPSCTADSDCSGSTGPCVPMDEVTNFCFDTEDEDLTLDANVVLSVTRDRTCKEWLSCISSVSTVDIHGESQTMCIDTALCDQLDPKTKKCVSYADITPGASNPLEFRIVSDTPTLSTIGQAKYLSGYSKAGASWRGVCDNNPITVCETNTDCGAGTCSLAQSFATGDLLGYFPYSGAEQVGSSHRIFNADFEGGFTYPWLPRFDDETRPGADLSVVDAGINEGDISQGNDGGQLALSLGQVLRVEPVVQPEGVSGAKVSLGTSLLARDGGPALQYYASFDVRSGDDRINELLVQFGFNDYINFSPAHRIPVSSGWQRVIAGPIEFNFANIPVPPRETFLGILVDTKGLSGALQPFFIDNITIQPVLNIAPGDTNPASHITRTCRSYAADDAPTCRYLEVSTGRELQGWEGYCVEVDPRNPRRCIQWLPVDLVAGSNSALSKFTQAGYGTDKELDRRPLYYCSQAKGNAPYIRNVLPGAQADERNLGGIISAVSGVKSGATLLRDFARAPVIGVVAPGNGWKSESGLYTWHQDNPAGTSLFSTTDGSLLKDFYEWEIEQIRIFVVGAQKGSQWANGQSFTLSLANNWEMAWCGDSDRCEDTNNENRFTRDESPWYWKNIVTYSKDLDPLIKGCEDSFDDAFNGNLFGIHFVFDENTKQLDRVEAGLCDATNKDGWLEIELEVYLREWCTEVAQVVDPFGNNAAWASRIHKPSYSVPGLGYDLNRDLAPYGGIVAPEPDYNPSLWDTDDAAPGRQPLLVEPANTIQFTQKPYQARASSPYGVETSSSLGGNPGSGSTSQCPGGRCQIFAGAGGSISSCFGGTRSGQVCTIGFDVLDNLLGDKVCVAGDLSKIGQACISSASCDSTAGICGNAICQGGPTPGATCNIFIPDDCGSGGTCETTCSTGPNIGQACTLFGGECSSGDGICGGGGLKRSIGTGTCVSGGNLGVSCSDHRQCGNGADGSPGRCTGVVLPSITSEKSFMSTILNSSIKETLGSLFARSQKVWQWNNSSREYVSDSVFGCPISGECPNGTGWDITGDEDIAIPPRVENIFVEGGINSSYDSVNNAVVFGGQAYGSVTLSFNSIVDDKQLPLVRYTIDWGDGKVSEESDLRIIDQHSKPHVLAHTYICGDENGCLFTPRIQIEDNWGWCSGSVTNASVSWTGNGSACTSWNKALVDVAINTPPIITPPSTNQDPIADAFIRDGANLAKSVVISESDLVTLDAVVGPTGSFDPDGDPITFSWRDGFSGSVLGTSSVLRDVSFAVGIHSITLTVDDGKGGSDTDSVQVSVNTSGGFAGGATIFVTSQQHRANIIGSGILPWVDDFSGCSSVGDDAQLAANCICTSLANNPSSNVEPGEWRAWLSTDEGVANSCINNAIDNLAGRTDTALVLPSGPTVADNLADLSSGSLQAPINRDETGSVILPGPVPTSRQDLVWTGTRTNGQCFTTISQDYSCGGWQNTNIAGAGAEYGEANSSDIRWTQIGTAVSALSCDSQARLYCIYYDNTIPDFGLAANTLSNTNQQVAGASTSREVEVANKTQPYEIWIPFVEVFNLLKIIF